MEKFSLTIKFVAAFATLGLMPTAWANDTAVGLDGGDLVFKKTPGIKMESEDLFISTTLVRVRYTFRNLTSSDIETMVAFPLEWESREPDDPEFSPQDQNFSAGDPNPLNFSVSVDGKELPFKVDRKWDKVKVKLTYYWTQRFPAKSVITVEHSYQPAAEIGIDDCYNESKFQNANSYCIDRSTQAALEKVHKKCGDFCAKLERQEITYILQTANNWSGPIGDFHLVIDKGNPKAMVSLCISGLKKISPTRFELRKKDYNPKADLRILFCGAPNPKKT